MRVLGLVGILWALATPSVAAPPVEDYGRLPGIEVAAISQSGEMIALAARARGQRQLLVMGPDQSALVSIILDDAKVRDIQWAGDDYVLITGTRTIDLDLIGSSLEVTQIGALNIKTGKLAYVFSSGRAQNGVWGQYGLRQIDGKWWGWFGGLTMEEGRLKTGHADLYKVDLETGGGVMVARGGEDYRSRDWLLDEKGAVIAHSDYLDSGRWRLFVKDQKVVDVADALGSFRILGMGRKAGTVLYGASGDEGREYFETAPGVTGEGERLLGEQTAKGGVSLLYDPWDSLLIGSLKDGDRPTYSYFSVAHQQRARLVERAFKDQRARIVSFSKGFQKAIIFTDGNGDSGTYYLVDFKTNRADEIGRPYPTIDAKDVGRIRTVSYKAGDGLQLEGILTLPPAGGEKLPLVVLPHGGPLARDYPGFDWWAQAFAARGYAVFQPNFRGSTGYGQDLIDAAVGEFGRKMQSDVSEGVAYLAAEGIVDPKRACIVGASYGGYAALAGVTLQKGLYRCAVSYSGVTNVPEIVEYDQARGGSTPRRFWRNLIGSQAVMKQISPVHLAEDADAPVLLIHGKDDTVVPFEQSKDMERALRRARKPVEFLELDGEDHWLSIETTRIAMLKASVAFVEKHNPAN